MRESTIEKYLHGCVEAAGGTTRKFVSPGHNGVPDRIVIWPEREPYPATIHFIETKAPKKGPTIQQAREHKRLRDLGCAVHVINTKELVDQYLRRYG